MLLLIKILLLFLLTHYRRFDEILLSTNHLVRWLIGAINFVYLVNKVTLKFLSTFIIATSIGCSPVAFAEIVLDDAKILIVNSW